MQMSKAGTKGLVSSEERVATINNGLSENMDLELSQRIERVGMDGEETEGQGHACWERVVAQGSQLKICLAHALLE